MPAKKQDTSKTQQNTDKLLDKQLIGIMVQDPFGDEDDLVASYIDYTKFARNGTGIKTLAKQLTDAKALHKSHGDKTVQDLVLYAFADVVKSKSSKWVIDQMSGVSDELKSQARLAKIDALNLAIKDKCPDEVKQAVDLQSERKALQSQIDEMDKVLSKLKKDVASKIGIDATFDLGLSDKRGFFVPSVVKQDKSRKTIDRTFDKDEYSKTGKITGDNDKTFEVSRNAKVLSRDKDGSPDAWQVTLKCNGKTYTGKTSDDLDSLYKLTKSLRDELMDNVIDKSKNKTRAVHVYSFLGID